MPRSPITLMPRATSPSTVAKSSFYNERVTFFVAKGFFYIVAKGLFYFVRAADFDAKGTARGSINIER